MLKKLASWFIVFGLSFLVANVFKWTEQGKAFVFINVGLFILLLIVECILGGSIINIATIMLYGSNEAAILQTFTKGMLFLYIMRSVFMIALPLIASWGATKLFEVNFFTTYQMITFGQSLVITYKNNQKEDED